MDQKINTNSDGSLGDISKESQAIHRILYARFYEKKILKFCRKPIKETLRKSKQTIIDFTKKKS